MSLREENNIGVLQEYYKALGSVLDVHAFTFIQHDITDHEISLQAVLKAMRMTMTENDGPPWRIYPDSETDLIFRIKIYEDIIPTGKVISFADFLGPGYDLSTGEVQLFEYVDHVRASRIMDGLAFAFLDPPHGLKLGDRKEGLSVEFGGNEQRVMTELFNGFLKSVLLIQNTNQVDQFVIYTWSNDWSNYFDAGKEWWGSFCWSVLDKKRNRITTIAASTTD